MTKEIKPYTKAWFNEITLVGLLADGSKTMPSGCMIWQRGKTSAGYGELWWKKKVCLTHRLVWELHHGPIPKGMHICHTCDMPSCIEPSHLFMGTARDNAQDRVRKGRNKFTRCFGEAHGLSKLTEKQVRAIRRDTRTQTEIAKDYGVHKTNIGYIKRRVTWPHI